MQEKANIQTSTLRVPKNILEEIKIYCRKAGKPVGEWVETAWKFIEKNDFDIYDKETTPFLPVPPDIEKERNQVEALCMLMSEFITAQKQIQLPAPELIAKTAEEKVRAEMKSEEQAKELKVLQEENDRLRNEIKVLQEYKEKAYRELCRVRDEQKTIGKIKVNTSKDYASEVSSYTKGLGTFMVKPCGYQITKGGYSDNTRMEEKDKLLFMFEKSVSSK